jgi:uncharacterized protein
VTDVPWLAALGLFLVFEGLLPLIAPSVWRESMQRIAQLADGQIRFVALGSIALGAVLLLI